MPIRITEVEPRNEVSDLRGGTVEWLGHRADSADVVPTSAKRPTVFKVEGTLYLNDAKLLQKICREVSGQTGRPVVIELSNICFLDGESAAVLCRMKREQGVSIEGLNLFIKKVMELADDSGSG